MKHHLLPEGANFYRANLHSHTNLSDGTKAPAEMKEFYKSHGYQVLAMTDHDVFIRHSDLSDEDFLVLNGYEMEVNGGGKTCHMCLVALDESTDTQVCWHRTKFVPKHAEAQRPLCKFDETLPDYEREYSHEGVSDMMKKGREGGFFVTYNHPTWSLQGFEDYIGYDGMNAMEIVNYACVTLGYDEVNPRVYEDILKSGKRILCTANDDNHNRTPDDDPMCDSFGGFTMIAAESLDYRKITSALEKGEFYAAVSFDRRNAPEIRSLVWDDEEKTLTVKSSDARMIGVYTTTRPSYNRIAPAGETVSELTVKLDPAKVKFFRVEVTDVHGNRAFSNAYFIDEIEGN